MKKLLLLTLISASLAVSAQQVPISENYFLDKYSLAPSYAGNFNTRYLFMGYRSDWTGIDGGPKTIRLSFNDRLPVMQDAGYGVKMIYDNAGIFSQLYVLGSYSYNLKINPDQNLMFGLSMGVYRNRLNLLDYYNDPGYSIDPALISQDIASKLKFMSDFSAIWTFKGLEAGFMFSNITAGDASYREVNLKYNPLANFQFHSTYEFEVSEDLDLVPLVILRGGRYIKSQFEIASQVLYLERFSGSIVYRDPGILGFGAGASVGKGLKIGYNFNFATNVAFGAFNNHEVCLGVNFFDFASKP